MHPYVSIAVGAMLVAVSLLGLRMLVTNAKARSRAAMDDDVDFDDWKHGSSDDPAA